MFFGRLCADWVVIYYDLASTR